jgi:hypothetical protein
MNRLYQKKTVKVTFPLPEGDMAPSMRATFQYGQIDREKGVYVVVLDVAVEWPHTLPDDDEE